MKTRYSLFLFVEIICLLHLIHDSLESLRIVYSEVSEHLTVDLNACLVESTHQSRVAHVLQTCSSINTLNPQRTEVALFVATVTISIGQTFLPGVLCYRPNILSCTKVTLGKLKNTSSFFFFFYVIN